MKYLPTDVSTFSLMIEGNYLYIDKTEYIYNLFKEGESRYYFLSRPRRFGKTLLISTLKELFSGNKELFKDLWIYKSTYRWDTYPVIHLDFSTMDYATVEELKLSLSWTLSHIAQSYDIDISQAPTPSTKLTLLVEQLSKKNKVVILIDEYDKPLLDNLKDYEKAEAQRDALKSFYGTLKGLDIYLRALFITGVSKFAKTSIFSGINNLNDISLKPEAAQLLGYTAHEINYYFKEYILQFTRDQQRTPEATIHEMQRWYNGYRFSENPIKVYNPFSVLYYLKDHKLANYWFESGTPSFLIKLLQKQYQSLEDLALVELSSDSLGTFTIDNIPLIPLLFQAGYLTIADYNSVTRKFTLNYPNLEVEESFKKYLVAALAYSNPVTVDTMLSRLLSALHAEDFNTFCTYLQSLFAHIPYTLHIPRESYYHSLFQFLMSLLSLEASSEILTDKGRIDSVISTKTTIYIFKFKYNTDPEKALKQIQEQKYYEPYIIKGKPIIAVGLAFHDEKEKLIIRWQSKELAFTQ